ncbi:MULTISPECIES: ATP-dependent zinc metalloprotease FtsH [Bacillales]|jgi:cell division protease FtsH|uniref:ATP-dependent zinc metalloprotease FtsH n=1 Tax=Brevibacillus aydinogluensis TaxID=927786 RepID=A0AA48MCA9_9BACL|nr:MULTISPECIES: ATP-dependent zinc metalloprotease FtsH [Bacillales]REK67424.1 MAG: cell division protein FtsH [Brevibacillus sp.]MBR8659860.1 ATP-dependent zinc metalloprotease FtsH [Brevibacillus sp. NL20B1]MDT3416807.1 cell division protease FtsH [Brevibacillus aydinogluensis]NNV04227.1 ATP-dependent metallopeptidase FtsH/Yme1/Tma family protein [Brevibacillus sp. MCWH]UFJ62317.1 ATP-dependent zinc metalloprotease FtsH [Anoxybacillus sediminis]
MNRFFRNTGFYLLIFLVTVGIVNFILSGSDKVAKLTYQEFRVQLQANNISELSLRPEGSTYRVEGTLLKSQGQENEKFITYVPLYDSDMIALLNEKIDAQKVKRVEFGPQEGNSIWLTFLTSIIPFVIIFILFFFLLNQAQGGGSRVMNFGKSRAKLYNEEKKRVTFDDVAGADEEKAELEEVVDFLKDPRKFNAVGARIPKGVLLVGPPGTGKTLLARAVAGEAGVPFFSISGSDFVEMFVGVGASRVRDLFENAKKNAPCIIFIDEIDAVGRQRGAGLGGGHDEREQTLNQLLVEMDGFAGNEGIIIIAATNRPDILDPALLRPGRFDRQITVDRPDIKGREAVLKVHARNKPLGDDVKLDVIARGTSGFTGADLENLLNEAALLTARKNKKQISMEEVDEAIDRVIAGPAKKSRVISEEERRLVAYHEAGHTIVGYHLKNAEMVHKVTIIPRGQAGGYTVMLPKEDRFFATKSDLLDKITGLLGGRVAEELVLGDISTGAHNDFQRATAIARSMITEYGMSRLGPMQFGRNQGQVFLGRDIGHERNYSDQIAYEIDQEMQRIINECYERCKELLIKHRDQLELVATTLLRVETLDAEQIKRLIETGKLEEDDTAADNSDVVVNIQPKKDEETNEEPKA